MNSLATHAAVKPIVFKLCGEQWLLPNFLDTSMCLTAERPLDATNVHTTLTNTLWYTFIHVVHIMELMCSIVL